jgi:RNA polymerase sigma-70 factor (sigma-E family)
VGDVALSTEPQPGTGPPAVELDAGAPGAGAPGLLPGPAPAATSWDVADLYRARHGDMVRLAYVLTGSQEQAADVAQEAFVKLFRKWDTVREPEAYLRRIVVNDCRSAHRRARRERDHAEGAGEPVVLDLEADELSDALASLPHRQRAAIVLRYYHDCSEREIAQVLGCRPGTVGSLLHRGLARLREVIER